MENNQERLNRALDRLQRLASYNGPHGARVDAEREYGAAYQELVKDGQRRQLREKYR